IELQRLLIRRYAILQLAQALMGDAQVDVGAHEAWTDLDGPPVKAHRLGEVGPVLKHQPEVVEKIGPLRRQNDRPLQERQGLVWRLQVAQHQRQAMQGLGAVLLQLQRGPESLRGLLQLELAMQRAGLDDQLLDRQRAADQRLQLLDAAGEIVRLHQAGSLP